MRLAREIGADVIAVGVETAKELAEIRALKITAAQGYLLGRPSVHPLDWQLTHNTSRKEIVSEHSYSRLVHRSQQRDSTAVRATSRGSYQHSNFTEVGHLGPSGTRMVLGVQDVAGPASRASRGQS
ncbi:EAL domain-containing protein [Paenarthrobacter sp. CM16]|uniref:EAL domain-containing protein n=1 Tax=Paenarthrobacter sp. CM16 TaxID=2738447 RepID=UPI001554D4F8|nr:EAL domain-containing protein [Paenarthrobacter sp. CM16]NQD87658.1 EAL domain-containing protein [Paenarthrobacter sp. CM16]